MALSMRSTVHIHWLVPSAAAVSTLTLCLLPNFLQFNPFLKNIYIWTGFDRTAAGLAFYAGFLLFNPAQRRGHFLRRPDLLAVGL